MKNNRLFAIAAAAVILFSGCENDFDPQIYGSFTQNNYPKTKSDYISCAMACYIPFINTPVYNMGLGTQTPMTQNDIGVKRVFDTPTDIMAPMLVTDLTGDWIRFSKADFGNCVNYARGSQGQNTINHLIKAAEITRMTHLIGLITDAPDNILDKETKESLLGEMRLCRGLHMYYVLHIYGPLPMITDPALIYDENALFSMARPSLDAVAGWIAADLEYAVQHAPLKSQVTEKGRFNRDFARFCLMKHCLNEGSHMDGYYQRAIDMYDELKRDGNYDLFQEGDNPFAAQFTSAHKFNVEVIMAVSCSTSANGTSSGGNYNHICKYMIPKDASKVKGDNPELEPAGAGWNHYYNMSPKFYDLFDANDLRRKTILTQYKASDGTMRTRETIGRMWNGFIVNKFKPEAASEVQPMDVPVARWADVLLMYAEALTRRDNAVSQPAVDAVNEVRKRAGLGGLSAAKTSAPAAFLDAILDERGFELFYEGFRKIDLIRFNKYAQKTKWAKGSVPTHQYLPLPNFAVQQAAEHGVELSQTYSRPGWGDDLAAARNN